MNLNKNSARHTFAGDDPILRPDEASAYCRLSTSTLAKRRLRGDPPVFVKLGQRLVGYRLSSLDRWLADCRRTSTSDAGGEADR